MTAVATGFAVAAFPRRRIGLRRCARGAAATVAIAAMPTIPAIPTLIVSRATPAIAAFDRRRRRAAGVRPVRPAVALGAVFSTIPRRPFGRTRLVAGEIVPASSADFEKLPRVLGGPFAFRLVFATVVVRAVFEIVVVRRHGRNSFPAKRGERASIGAFGRRRRPERPPKPTRPRGEREGGGGRHGLVSGVVGRPRAPRWGGGRAPGNDGRRRRPSSSARFSMTRRVRPPPQARIRPRATSFRPVWDETRRRLRRPRRRRRRPRSPPDVPADRNPRFSPPKP